MRDKSEGCKRRWRTHPSQHVSYIRPSTTAGADATDPRINDSINSDIGFRQDDEHRDPTYVLNQSQKKSKHPREKRKVELSETGRTLMENLQKEFDEAEDFDLIVEDATPPDRFVLQPMSPAKTNECPESSDERNSFLTPRFVTRVRQEGLEKQATPLRRFIAQKSLEGQVDKSPSTMPSELQHSQNTGIFHSLPAPSTGRDGHSQATACSQLMSVTATAGFGAGSPFRPSFMTPAVSAGDTPSREVDHISQKGLEKQVTPLRQSIALKSLTDQTEEPPPSMPGEHLRAENTGTVDDDCASLASLGDNDFAPSDHFAARAQTSAGPASFALSFSTPTALANDGFRAQSAAAVTTKLWVSARSQRFSVHTVAKSTLDSLNLSAQDQLPFYLIGFEGERTDFNELLHICQQKKLMRWEERFAKDTFAKVAKIGEGAYGEVFKVNLDGQPCAIKVIPFRDEQFPAYKGQVNGEYLNHTAQMLPEVVMMTELSKLRECEEGSEGYMTPGFVRLHGISIVQGKYPTKLSAAWDRYAQLKKGSENDRPGDYATDDQLFLVFAMAQGGPDLERVNLKTQGEALSIFVQVALSLAVAEERLQCEHRDLHEGNVLVDKTPVNETIRFEFNGDEVFVQTHGVKATIIDFTLSRISKGGWTVFTDLAKDEELFTGQGSYQFDIYRMMREHNTDEWEAFHPKTNLFWLHYLSEKLLEKLKEPLRCELRLVFKELLEVDTIRDFLIGETFYPYFEKCVKE